MKTTAKEENALAAAHAPEQKIPWGLEQRITGLEQRFEETASLKVLLGLRIALEQRLAAVEDLVKAALAPPAPRDDPPYNATPAPAAPEVVRVASKATPPWAEIKAWSLATFGPGRRTTGLLEHIRRELDEVAEAPDDLVEWVDVVLLAFDGYWRHGGTPEGFIDLVRYKFGVNQARKWGPPAPEDQPNAHVKETPPAPAAKPEHDCCESCGVPRFEHCDGGGKCHSGCCGRFQGPAAPAAKPAKLEGHAGPWQNKEDTIYVTEFNRYDRFKQEIGAVTCDGPGRWRAWAGAHALTNAWVDDYWFPDGITARQACDDALRALGWTLDEGYQAAVTVDDEHADPVRNR